MSYKHTPKKWWIDYERECHAFDVHADRERTYRAHQQTQLDNLVHRHKLVNGIDHYTLSPPKDIPTVTWQCYEEVGAQCLTLEGQPIMPNMTVEPGMKILVPHLLCIINVPETYARATIKDELHAYDENNVWFLSHDPVRGLVSSGGGNLRAIAQLKFAEDP